MQFRHGRQCDSFVVSRVPSSAIEFIGAGGADTWRCVCRGCCGCNPYARPVGMCHIQRGIVCSVVNRAGRKRISCARSADRVVRSDRCGGVQGCSDFGSYKAGGVVSQKQRNRNKQWRTCDKCRCHGYVQVACRGCTSGCNNRGCIDLCSSCHRACNGAGGRVECKHASWLDDHCHRIGNGGRVCVNNRCKSCPDCLRTANVHRAGVGSSNHAKTNFCAGKSHRLDFSC